MLKEASLPRQRTRREAGSRHRRLEEPGGGKLEPIIVPYLSPLVLRKELENVLNQEGDQCMTRADVAHDHPIIYCELVWYMKRLDAPSHLPGLMLRAKLINKGRDIPKAWATANSKHVVVRTMWDSPSLQEDLGKPMYLMWSHNLDVSPLVKALVTEQGILSRSLMQMIVNYIQQDNLQAPIKILLSQHMKRPSARHRSIYRDILYLAFTACGRDRIDHVAFDREYRLAFRSLGSKHLAKLQNDDLPPSNAIIWCRRMLTELELAPPTT
ncbi:PREDICTED: LOW QUALITY PROTEIN: DENN domain-containing protein 4C-like [Priapulus caudatus]|uniref:LOW QUALITY PROTEIN: DENN domain-containing protein 4C-like n=1 Tax=Priapulus caudatus TaxID=37621 RepID=A0ABM1E6X0_PRICU|nr:PREDICTED: LOW QUALITY PROTEIN: DENN domain-containing protein 4C-like [Priapulus caudatus]